jgi:hypothetical protein
MNNILDLVDFERRGEYVLAFLSVALQLTFICPSSKTGTKTYSTLVG